MRRRVIIRVRRNKCPKRVIDDHSPNLSFSAAAPMFRFLVLLLIGLASLAAYIGFTAHSFNHFAALGPHIGERCVGVSGMLGPKDLQPVEASGRVFISSLDRRGGATRGGIFVLDINDPLADYGWRDRTKNAPENFLPGGLYHYEEDGVERLFVTNKAAASVEIYAVEGGGDLIHIETVTHPALTNPVDLVAVGPREFYVTNDLAGRKNWLAMRLRFLTRSASSTIVHVKDGAAGVVANSLKFATGIGLQKGLDGAPDRLLVSEMAAGRVRIFDLPRNDAPAAELTTRESVKVGGAPSFMNIDGAGNMIVSVWPKPLSFALHVRDASFLAPSMVLKLAAQEQGKTAQHVLYRDKGAELSASTVAARMGNTLLVGAAYEDKFLMCPLGAH